MVDMKNVAETEQIYCCIWHEQVAGGYQKPSERNSGTGELLKHSEDSDNNKGRLLVNLKSLRNILFDFTLSQA